jgi:hypothetical protein
MITDDNGDTIFVNEVQPKPTSPGHNYGRSSPNRNIGRSGIPTIRRLPPASLSLCRHGYDSSSPIIFMRRLGLQSMTRPLPYTAKYNFSPIVTGLYKYSTQYLTILMKKRTRQQKVVCSSLCENCINGTDTDQTMASHSCTICFTRASCWIYNPESIGLDPVMDFDGSIKVQES